MKLVGLFSLCLLICNHITFSMEELPSDHENYASITTPITEKTEHNPIAAEENNVPTLLQITNNFIVNKVEKQLKEYPTNIIKLQKILTALPTDLLNNNLIPDIAKKSLSFLSQHNKLIPSDMSLNYGNFSYCIGMSNTNKLLIKTSAIPGYQYALIDIEKGSTEKAFSDISFSLFQKPSKLALSPDGDYIAAVLKNSNEIKIINTQTMALEQTISTPSIHHHYLNTGEIYILQFSHDSKKIAYHDSRSHTIQIFNINQQRSPTTNRPLTIKISNTLSVSSIEFSADDTRILYTKPCDISGKWKIVSIIDIVNKQPLFKKKYNSQLTPAISSDNLYLVEYAKKQISVYSINDNKVRARFKVGGFYPQFITFNNDNTMLVGHCTDIEEKQSFFWTLDWNQKKPSAIKFDSLPLTSNEDDIFFNKNTNTAVFCHFQHEDEEEDTTSIYMKKLSISKNGIQLSLEQSLLLQLASASKYKPISITHQNATISDEIHNINSELYKKTVEIFDTFDSATKRYIEPLIKDQRT